MTIFKKIILGILFLLAVAPSYAFAGVVFEQTPLFKNTNFAPGGTVLRHITVNNSTGGEKTVIIEAINSVCETPCLADMLHTVISGDDIIYFDGTLSAFLAKGELSLGALPSGASRIYAVNVSFSDGAENAYQTKTVGFDLLVGFMGEESHSDNPTIPGGSSGGSVFIPGLQVNNESATVFVDPNYVKIVWDTSYASYGHIVYGVDNGMPYSFDLTKPNFGYSFSFPNDPSDPNHVDLYEKTQHHEMVLSSVSGLIPGQTYRYRTVSHASPPTVSYERTFTVPGTKNAQKLTSDVPNNVNENEDVGNVIAMTRTAPVLPGNVVDGDNANNLTEKESDRDGVVLSGEPVAEAFADTPFVRRISNLASAATSGVLPTFGTILGAAFAIVIGIFAFRKLKTKKK